MVWVYDAGGIAVNLPYLLCFLLYLAAEPPTEQELKSFLKMRELYQLYQQPFDGQGKAEKLLPRDVRELDEELHNRLNQLKQREDNQLKRQRQREEPQRQREEEDRKLWEERRRSEEELRRIQKELEDKLEEMKRELRKLPKDKPPANIIQ